MKGEKNPMYSGFDNKKLEDVSYISLYFNQLCLLRDKKCNTCFTTEKLDGHHLIRQGKILQIIKKIDSLKYEDKTWLLSVYNKIHLEFADKIIVPLCGKCHAEARKGYEDIKIEERLLEELKFEANVRKLIENEKTQLGKKTEYKTDYDPDLIFPVSRKESRERIGKIDYEFKGIDIWNAYEFSALDLDGKPYCVLLRIGYDCFSESIVESKSLKLYLNSFNQTKITLSDSISKITKDLQERLKANWVNVIQIDREKFFDMNSCTNLREEYKGAISVYEYDPSLLEFVETSVKEPHHLVFDSFKSNCRHSGLPDWGTMIISYQPKNKAILEYSLLQYLVSFRNHKEFHEECVERVLFDLYKKLDPKWIRVECKYTRRGGIDINPIRYVGPDDIHKRYELEHFERTLKQ